MIRSRITPILTGIDLEQIAATHGYARSLSGTHLPL